MCSVNVQLNIYIHDSFTSLEMLTHTCISKTAVAEIHSFHIKAYFNSCVKPVCKTSDHSTFVAVFNTASTHFYYK